MDAYVSLRNVKSDSFVRHVQLGYFDIYTTYNF
jgi:hypothetical protein